jgi:hypothetical protein
VEAHPTHSLPLHCVIFFRPKGHSVINKYFVSLNMESVYHIVAIRVNETSWAHVWRLHSCYLKTGCDKDAAAIRGSPDLESEEAR